MWVVQASLKDEEHLLAIHCNVGLLLAPLAASMRVKYATDELGEHQVLVLAFQTADLIKQVLHMQCKYSSDGFR